MHKKTTENLISFDPEIERTISKLRKQSKNKTSNTQVITSETNMAGRQDLSIKDWGTPNITQQPLGIIFPNLDEPFELRSGLIHLLPKFHGLNGEDPHKHLKEFHVVCSTMKPQSIPEDQVKLRAFPFSLDGAAKDWLYYLETGAVNNWDEMKRLFLERFFPASRTANLRKEISGIRQYNNETLYEYWERFKKLCASCPHHQIPEQLLIQYFYEGLIPMDRSMLDAASGGVLMDKTPTQAKTLISNMASNSQQFYRRDNQLTKPVHNIENQPTNDNEIKDKLEELTKFVRQLAVNTQSASIHNEETCIWNQGEADVNGVYNQGNTQNYNQGNQQRYKFEYKSHDPNLNNHPNLRYGNSQENTPSNNSNTKYIHPNARQDQNSNSALFDLVKELVASNQELMAANQTIQAQMSQMASELNKLKNGQIPSQSEMRPRDINSVMLRNGKQVIVGNSEEPQKIHEFGSSSMGVNAIMLRSGREVHSENKKDENSDENKNKTENSTNTLDKPTLPFPKPTVPFPQRLNNKNKISEQDQELIESLKKVEINIPLLDAIRQIPKYARILKDLCTNKRKLLGNEKIDLSRSVSALIQTSIPTKCQDPGSFTIPCNIGNVKLTSALVDLGAAINVMPTSMYKTLKLGPLKQTGIVLKLANKSTVYPCGIIEDILVKVGHLIFPADFVIMDMKEDNSPNDSTLILGRPFLKTAGTRIDVGTGTLIMQVGEDKVEFRIFEEKKDGKQEQGIFCIEDNESKNKETKHVPEIKNLISSNDIFSEINSKSNKRNIDDFTHSKTSYDFNTENFTDITENSAHHKVKEKRTYDESYGLNKDEFIHSKTSYDPTMENLNKSSGIDTSSDLKDSHRLTHEEKARIINDQKIRAKDLKEGNKVMLYSSNEKFIPGLTKHIWKGPYLIHKNFPNGLVELEDLTNKNSFKIDGQRIKSFYETPDANTEVLALHVTT